MRDPLREPFDYRVPCDDFLLYELGRLIEEDRASFDEADFRRLIEAGIHEHIERRIDIRAEIAARLRRAGSGAFRGVLRAVEDIESGLGDAVEIIRSYTAYLFARLEECAASDPDERLTAAADALLDPEEDRAVVETALDVLGRTPSAIGARVLAHVISEPLLEEDLELKAYALARACWPLARQYILYSLKPHSHEDIPFRWFQLLAECDEPSVADRVLEELVVHGEDPRYLEDLASLAALLHTVRDPELEAKVLQLMNSGELAAPMADLLEQFLRERPAGAPENPAERSNPWVELDRIYALNRSYLAAARLFDTGRKEEAARALDDILSRDPYPFAVMLKPLLQTP